MAIRIDNSEAKQALVELKDKISLVKNELDELDKAGQKETEAYKEKKKVLDELNVKYNEQRKTVGLVGLSYADLRKGARSLRSQLDNAIPGTEKYKALQADLKITEARMKELRGTAVETRFSISKLADGFNKYAAVGAGIIATMTGIALTARKCVDEFAEMQEAESQVRKYTGMTKEEVSGLNEEFKKMDTRTARTRLNELAGDAGKLGITGKKDVLEFVDAANMINVALGDDLGEDAVKNIGKLAQMFGEDKKLGLRGAMLATGSAINEVAQNSSAAEAYLVGFTARVAGAANQAKVAQGNIIGYASVLDQNMQQQEMAATAFQTLMMKMYQEPAKFAKMTGQNVAEFTKLIKTDANEAILQLLDTLNKKGGLDKLAPMFKEMGLDGVRASGVISTMAGKVDDIRKAQNLANKAYEDGTSIINEYNIQNTTAQAELEKAKKHFADVRVELGEKLMPVMKHMISGGSLTVKMLSTIISVMIEYKSVIISVTAAIAIYTAAVNASILADKAKLLWTGRVVTAFKTLFNVAKANPWAAAIGAGAALIGVLIDLKRKQDAVSDSTKSINNIKKQSQKVYEDESYRVRVLTDLIHNENVANELKKKYISELKSIIPGYNGMLSDEGKLINDNKESIEQYLVQLERQIKMKAAQEELEDLFRKKYAAERRLKTEVKTADTAKTNLVSAQFVATSRSQKASTPGTKNLAYGLDQGVKTMQTEYENAAKAVAGTKEELQGLEQVIKDVNSEIKKNVEIPIPTVIDENKGGGNGDSGDDKDKQPWNARLQTAENAYKQELLLLRKSSDEQAQTENEYRLDALQKESEYQVKKLAIIKEYQSYKNSKKDAAELGKLENNAREATYNALEQSEEVRLNLLKEYRDRGLETVNQGEKKLQLELAKEYEAGKLKEKDYKNRVLAVEVSSYTVRLAIAKDYLRDVEMLEFRNGETKASAIKEAGEKVLESEKEISEKRAEVAKNSAELINKYADSFNEDKENLSLDSALSALETFYQAQLALLNENGQDTTALTEAYNEAKLSLQKKYQEKSNDLIDKYGLGSLKDKYQEELKLLKDARDAGLITEEQYQKASAKLTSDYIEAKIRENKRYYDIWMEALSNMSSAVQGFQDAEVSKVENTYDKKINAAKKAGKDTTKLEEEKEEAVAAVKKKYAAMQFAINVMQTISATALSAMLAYSSLAWIPVVGPVLGAAAAAAAIAAGAAQIAVAKQQKDEAMGLKSGGYSDDYVQGYTESGNSDDVAGAIPVHKNEFVANHEAVANPHVRQFLDVFNVAQSNGTVRMINTTQILEQVRTKSGKYSGGYVADETKNDSNSTSLIGQGTGTDISLVLKLLQKCVDLLGVISVKDLKVNARDVRDEIKRIEQLEKNVSR